MAPKDWLPIAVSAVSLLVALVTLYRVELRGPSVKLKWVEAPHHWNLDAGWFQADDSPTGEWCRLQVTGTFGAIVENFGSRSGVAFGISVTVQGMPTDFNVITGGFETKPLTIDGKSTIALEPYVTLESVVAVAADALVLFHRSDRDLLVTIQYQASRPWGRIVADSHTIPVRSGLLINPVEEWVKEWQDR